MQAADLRVVVIEDESDSALVIHTALQVGGVQAWAAQTAEEGLILLNEVGANLLLVDLALPGMDGWAFLSRVRANPRLAHIPAVVMSAYLTRTVAQKALNAGFVACLAKPMDITSLVDQLLTIMDKAALEG